MPRLTMSWLTSVGLLAIILILTPAGLRAQSVRPAWAWAQHGGSAAESDGGSKVATDAQGNSYVLGYLRGPGLFGTVAVPYNGGILGEVFLAKYSPAGVVEWVRVSAGGAWVGSLAVDAAGNCYATMSASQFAGQALGANLQLLKVNSAGVVQWHLTALRIPGSGVASSAGYQRTGVAVGSAGDLFVATSYRNGVAIAGTDTLGPALASATWTCVAKYDSARTLQWAFTTRGGSLDPTGFGLDATGSFYLTGLFTGTVHAGADSVRARSAVVNTLLLKLSPAGTVRWLRQGHSTTSTYTYPSALAVDAAGACFLAGSFEDSIRFAGLELLNHYRTREQAYLLKYDSAGTLLWGRRVDQGTDSCQICNSSDVHDVAVDADGACYVAGAFRRRLIINGDTLVTQRTDHDAYVAKFSAAGRPLWSQSGGELGGGFWTEAAIGIAVDAGRHCSVTGKFDNTAVFDDHRITSHGATDMFLVRLDPTGSDLGGSVYLDYTADGSRTSGEPLAQAPLVVEAQPGPVYMTARGGLFGAYVPPGPYTLTVPNPPAHYVVTTPPQSVVLTAAGQSDTTSAIGLWPEASINDLRVTLTSTGLFAPLRQVRFHLSCTNTGTTVQSATAMLRLDPQLHLLFSRPYAPAVGQLLSWTLPALAPMQTRTVDVTALVDSTVMFGTFATSEATLTSAALDILPADNTDVSVDPLRTAVDPNDKRVSAAALTPAQVQAGEWLTYTVRFQNTGTAPALRVIIRDTLDAHLQRASLQVLSASHPVRWKLQGAGVAEFRFDAIELSDSATNELNSHGFVKYRVRVQSTLVIDDSVTNTAHIIFDYNDPIATNAVITRVQVVTGELAPPLAGLVSIQPNPARAYAHLTLTAPSSGPLQVRVINALGQEVWQETITVPAGPLSRALPTGLLAPGVYQVRALFGRQLLTRRLVVAP